LEQDLHRAQSIGRGGLDAVTEATQQLHLARRVVLAIRFGADGG
jgi:hypothetical protein